MYACIAICVRLQHKVLYIFVLIHLLLSSIFCFDYSKTIFYMLHLQLYLAFLMFYLQEHESTTVGLMLGLAASYKGTMQPAISKVNTCTSLTSAPFSSIFVLLCSQLNCYSSACFYTSIEYERFTLVCKMT